MWLTCLKLLNTFEQRRPVSNVGVFLLKSVYCWMIYLLRFQYFRSLTSNWAWLSDSVMLLNQSHRVHRSSRWFRCTCFGLNGDAIIGIGIYWSHSFSKAFGADSRFCIAVSRMKVIQAFEPSNCFFLITIVMAWSKVFPCFSSVSRVFTALTGSHFPSLRGSGSLAGLFEKTEVNKARLRINRFMHFIATDVAAQKRLGQILSPS